MKKIIFLAFCLVIGFVGVWFRFSCSSEQDLERSLTIANVEALSSGELLYSVSSCAQKISDNDNYGRKYNQVYCGDCKEHMVTKVWGEGTCSK